MKTLVATIAVLVLACTSGAALAADPPEAIHYQGVLRDAEDNPRTGTFSMIFRLFDDPDFGVPLLCDAQSVEVTGGLFAVRIGETANVEACMGAEDAVTLDSILARFEPLYLQIAIDGEMLWPRIRLASSPYALNARKVRGREIVSTGPLDLYVDASGGDDGNDGLSLDSAKATIQAAVNEIPLLLGGNVTVHIQPGTYHEQVWIAPRNATELSLVELIGEGEMPSDVILDGTGVGDFPGVGMLIMLPGVSVVNMTFSNWDYEAGINVFGGGSVWLRDCRFVDNKADAPGEESFAGLSVSEGGTAEVVDCEFSHNETGIAAHLGGHVRFFDETGSTFDSNDLGIFVDRNSSVYFHNGGGTPNCTLISSPMRALDHSTISGYQTNCNPDGSSTCDTAGDPSGRCVP